MWHSIQENLKKINSQITLLSILSLGITTLVLVFLAGYLYAKHEISKEPVTYSQGGTGEYHPDARPFGAINSPVYTFSWCQGASKIKDSNKVFFRDAEEAERLGRTLSKLCDR